MPNQERRENAFHVLTEEVGQWLDSELRYIRQEVETFRGKFSFAFLAEEAEKRFNRSFSHNSFRLYAFKKGVIMPCHRRRGRVTQASRLQTLGLYSNMILRFRLLIHNKE